MCFQSSNVVWTWEETTSHPPVYTTSQFSSLYITTTLRHAICLPNILFSIQMNLFHYVFFHWIINALITFLTLLFSPLTPTTSCNSSLTALNVRARCNIIENRDCPSNYGFTELTHMQYSSLMFSFFPKFTMRYLRYIGSSFLLSLFAIHN
jgi:hypothetical protein